MDELQVEHRLTKIEEAIRMGFGAVDVRMAKHESMLSAVDQKLDVQNGRIGKLEEWRRSMEKAAEYARGVIAGRTSITKTQLAIAGGALGLLMAVVDIGVKFLT